MKKDPMKHRAAVGGENAVLKSESRHIATPDLCK